MRGFTLIELALVLVIIGLIVGGILVGQDLIGAGEVRATISQIEGYNRAVNTFRGKYGVLPGDMNAVAASQFGFLARGTCGGSTPCVGEGDGNGVIEGVNGAGASANKPLAICTGENGLFWTDLTYANGMNINLIEGSFSTAVTDAAFPGTPTTATTVTTVVSKCMPPARLGRGNFIYVYNSGGTNYYGMSVPTSLLNTGRLSSSPGLTVRQAYNMDAKADDGVPLTGNVLVYYVNNNISILSTPSSGSPAAATDCYDSATAPGAYALSAAASNVNCALSFKFQ